ncbi:flagellar hook-associated protein 3 [Oxalobacteraceae bacterium CAVE-383]|nr:flagellar hook-associated protein 3 [Oxalobacteraceae bacterium CAVE-383]
MSTRISSTMFYNMSTTSMLDLQASVVKLNQQATAGQRVLKPSDDPVASANALNVSQSQAVNTQLQTNRDNASTVLTQTEGTLGNIITAITDVKSQAISAGNGTFGDADRASIATALQGTFQQLLGYANTTDGLGNYLFAGYKSSTQPFVDGGSAGVSYNGDQGVQTLQVDTNRNMAVSSSGQAIFQGKGADVFKTVNDLITALQTPISPAANATEAANSKVVFDAAFGLAITGMPGPPAAPPTQAQIDAATAAATPAQLQAATNDATVKQQAHDTDYTRTDFTPGSTGALNQALAKVGKQVDLEINNVTTVRAQVGSNMAELTALDNTGSAKDVQYQQTLNTLLGSGADDITKTLSELAQQQTFLQVAQKSFSTVSGLSLLNFLH